MSVEASAIKRATSYYEDAARNWKVTNVSRLGGDYKGYDLLVERGSEKLKVEVKGSAKPYHGIPDLHDTELDAQGGLIADILFVVYLPVGMPEKIAIIPRNKFPHDAMQRKVSYCIRSGFKNRTFIQQFLEEM